MFKKVPEKWEKYRRKNLVASLGLVFGLPLVAVLVATIKVWLPNYAEYSFQTLSIIWCALWGWSAFCVVRWPCPRCGVPWLSHQVAEFGAKQCCSQCGLCLYEEP